MLSTLLGPNSWVRAGGIDQADHRQSILGGQSHLAHGLAVALGMGAAKVTCLPFGERLAFLMADYQDLMSIELGKAGQHGWIITKRLVAMQLNKLVKDEA